MPLSQLKKPFEEVASDTDIFDASDISDIEYFASGLRERINGLPIEEKIWYLENVRKQLKSRRETEVFTQGIIILVVLVILLFLLYFSL